MAPLDTSPSKANWKLTPCDRDSREVTVRAVGTENAAPTGDVLKIMFPRSVEENDIRILVGRFSKC
jgi:hypothetical protein